MTDSPINLDEAHRLIEVGRLNQELFTGHEKTGIQNVLIEYPYLESIVSELEAGRKRIADLEFINQTSLNVINDQQNILDCAIIPQAEDAQVLREIIHVLMSVRPCDYGTDGYHADVIRRYLAAIAGGKP